MVDIHVENHGSIFSFRPLTDAAHDWIDEYVSDDRQDWAGAVVVERRHIADIARSRRVTDCFSSSTSSASPRSTRTGSRPS